MKTKLAIVLRSVADKLNPPRKTNLWKCPVCHRWGFLASDATKVQCSGFHDDIWYAVEDVETR